MKVLKAPALNLRFPRIHPTVILLLLALGILPGQAMAQALTCNSTFNATFGIPGDPNFIGDPILISIDIGADDIDGGSFLDVDELTFGPDCGLFQGINACASPGNDVTFNNDIVTDCRDVAGNPVTFSVSPLLPFPEVIKFTPALPIRNYDPRTALPGQPTTCNLQFTVTVNALIPGLQRVREAFGWNLANGICDNFESSASDNTFSIVIDVPEIDIEKFTNGEQADTPTGPYILAGDPVNWRYDVTNTGNTPLFNVRVNDDLLGPITNNCDWGNSSDPGTPAGELSEGETVSCTATGVATNGQYENFGDVIGSFEGVDVTDIDPSHYFGVSPSITLLKEISIDGGANWFDANNAASAPVAAIPSDALYRITVTNSGDTDLENVEVSDDTIAYAWPYVVGDLAAGDSFTLDVGVIPALLVSDRCTSSGTYLNTASVVANPVVLPGVGVSDDDPANLVCVDPSISLLKEISVDGGANWFDANDTASAPITIIPSDAEYRITVTNTGDTDLENVEVSDDTIAYAWPFTVPGGLAVGASYVIDVGVIPQMLVPDRCTEVGVFLNTASVTANPVVLPGTPVTDDDVANLICLDPDLTMVKEISIDGGATWFDANDAASAPVATVPSDAQYRIRVFNTGQSDLENVEVSDDTIAYPWPYVIGDLDVGESFVIDVGVIPAMLVTDRCTTSGTYLNVASVTANPVDLPEETLSSTNPANLVCVDPAISLLKEISIDGGATWYDANDTASAPITVVPSDALYRITVTNTGDTDLENVEVSDDTINYPWPYVVGDLAAGDFFVIDAGVIPAMLVPDRCTNSGVFLNTASVTANPVVLPGTTLSDDDAANLICVNPFITLVKEISIDGGTTWFDANDAASAPVAAVPSDALYRIRVFNTGDTDLENVEISDDSINYAWPYVVGDLAAGDSFTLDVGIISALLVRDRCTSSGTYLNTASVTANPVDVPQEELSDSNPANLVCVDPSVTLLKEISIDGGATWFDANDTASAPVTAVPSDALYRITVTNTGDTDLETVEVSDDTIAYAWPFTVPGGLAAGDSYVIDSGVIPAMQVPDRCTGSGTFLNTASVSATPVVLPGTRVSDDDPAYLVCVNPLIALLKEISIDGGTTWFDANDEATAPVAAAPSDALYRITVTNTGDTDLQNVEVSDDSIDYAWPYVVGDLAAGDSFVIDSGLIPALTVTDRCTDSGTFLNTASVTAELVVQPDDTLNASDPANLVCKSPSISLEKHTNGEDADTPTGPEIPEGGEVLWEYFVTNTGDVTLTDVTVTDDQGVEVTCPETTLAPFGEAGDSMTCTGEGTAELGQYANIADVIGTPPVGPPVTDTDPSHYFSLPPTEDIPTLNWFGLLALALLMLGVAQVQMRRS